MTSLHSDDRLFVIGNPNNYGWNKKLCFQARDSLFECADSQDNGNKFRCPDELYAYEMWCPADFRRVHSTKRRSNPLNELIYKTSSISNTWIEQNKQSNSATSTFEYFENSAKSSQSWTGLFNNLTTKTSTKLCKQRLRRILWSTKLKHSKSFSFCLR